MINARKFLIDDIKAMMDTDSGFDWIESVNDNGLYQLWQDLVKIQTEYQDEISL